MDSKGFRQSAGKLWDAVAGPLADALTDIRQKVVEEGWFGRAVTPQLVKEIDQPGIHGKPVADAAATPASLEGGVHGQPEAGVSEKGPTPEGQRQPERRPPERSDVYREKVEALFDPANRPGQSFAEAVAERYAWGKDFWPMQKDIANAPGKDHSPEPAQEHGMER